MVVVVFWTCASGGEGWEWVRVNPGKEAAVVVEWGVGVVVGVVLMIPVPCDGRKGKRERRGGVRAEGQAERGRGLRKGQGGVDRGKEEGRRGSEARIGRERERGRNARTN